MALSALRQRGRQHLNLSVHALLVEAPGLRLAEAHPIRSTPGWGCYGMPRETVGGYIILGYDEEPSTASTSETGARQR